MKKALLKIYKKVIGYILKSKKIPRFHFLKILHGIIVSGLTPKSTMVQGCTMFLDSIDSLGLLKNGTYEAYTTELLQKIIRKRDVVLDIGANIGYFTLIFAKLVGENGKVYAFEPDVTNYNLLRKNIEINGFTNVISEQKALTDKTGKAKLYLNLVHKGMHRLAPQKKLKSIEIDTIRLDEYFENKDNRIDFVKIDVEGAEPAAFEGMENILKANKDIKIITEFNPAVLDESGFDHKEFLNLLVEMGFNLYSIDDDSKNTDLVSAIDLLNKYNFKNGFSLNLLCSRVEMDTSNF